ncbi:MAG: hypothetical protein JWN30_1503 [Bacilli bacterium]|nr:hypothetical protein [Bacilli bacterium]
MRTVTEIYINADVASLYIHYIDPAFQISSCLRLYAWSDTIESDVQEVRVPITIRNRLNNNTGQFFDIKGKVIIPRAYILAMLEYDVDAPETEDLDKRIGFVS